MYDVAIIGAGITGCSLFYELCRYRLRVILLEKENDVSLGATKANSAIVHAGYDPPEGTLMASANVRGNAMIPELCRRLDVPYRQTGSLVLAFSQEQMKTLHELCRRGQNNGVPGLRVLNEQDARALEPNLGPQVLGALYAPSAGVVSPWELALALAQNAVQNGGELALRSAVEAVHPQSEGFTVTAGGRRLRARFLVNAAGTSAQRVARMAGDTSFEIHPSKGEYFLLDKNQGALVSRVVFQCPGKAGKGVLVAPTVHGNLIVGPNAQPAQSDDTATTAEGLAFVREAALRSAPGIEFKECIRTFAGLRAVSSEGDFILRESAQVPGLFLMAGIKSPGLTAAPALAKDMASLLERAGLTLRPQEQIVTTRRVVRFRELNDAQRAEAVRVDPNFGRVVCRCETVTEAEIINALRAPVPPVSIDGVKRRCSCGMGRCQGGFCGPRVQQIIARELGIAAKDVALDRDGMTLLYGPTKGEAAKHEV